MNRRAFLATSMGAVFSARTAKAVGRRSVLFLLADNQRFDTIHELGNGVIRTPNLDQLVKSAFAFTNCFICDPWEWSSRASLLTGCNNFRAGVHRGNRTIDVQWPLWPEIMDALGYNTFFTGRWLDSVEPSKRGFHTVRYPVHSEAGSHELTVDTDAGRKTGFSTTLFTDAALEFLRSKPSPPFFVFISYMAPHEPWTPPEAFAKMYRPDRIPLPKNFQTKPVPDPATLGPSDRNDPLAPLDPDSLRRQIALYYGMISHLDEQVGRILDELKEARLEEDTIVIFTSDSGISLGSHGLFTRESLYDECLRVPLVIRAPERSRPGERSASLCQLHDLVPTVCDLVGVPPPNEIDGLSLVPVLTRSSVEPRSEVYAAYADSQRMVRSREWKLIHYPRADQAQLFRIDSDPEEMKDLAGAAGNRATVEQLMGKLGAYQKEMGDTVMSRPVTL